jgi:hypothetical protein
VICWLRYLQQPAQHQRHHDVEFAFGVNDKATIVGQYADSNTGTTPGLVNSSGALTTLNPALVTNAQGINDNGLVTGFYSTDATHSHGFPFNTRTSSYTLIADPDVPNFVFLELLGIRDSGEITGFYVGAEGIQHGFFAVPTPELGSLLLIGTGSLGLTAVPHRMRFS